MMNFIENFKDVIPRRTLEVLQDGDLLGLLAHQGRLPARQALRLLPQEAESAPIVLQGFS